MTDCINEQIKELKLSRIEQLMKEISEDTVKIQNLSYELNPDIESNKNNLELIKFLIHEVKEKINRLNSAVIDFKGDNIIW